MNIKKMTGRVRRNIVIDPFLAKNLEKMSDVTGLSQGEILETAMSQPIMQRMIAFTCPSGDNPLVELLETYQAYEGHMNPVVGEGILQTVRWWVDKRAIKKPAFVIEKEDICVNEYVCGHMPAGSRNADPYLASVYEQAQANNFVHPDMDDVELKVRVLKYIDVILAAPDDRNRMGESYLFRNLLIIIGAYFEAPAEADVEYMFNELCDGRVLPCFS